jgi:2-hydroxychromene-2-carboxylate isomerase
MLSSVSSSVGVAVELGPLLLGAVVPASGSSFPRGRNAMTATAAMSATMRAAERMNPGRVNGLRSLLSGVVSLMVPPGRFRRTR